MKKLFCLLLFGIGAFAANAGLYSSQDQFPFTLDSKGNAQELAFNDFKLLMTDWLAVPSPVGEKRRKQLEEQMAPFKKKDPSQLSAKEIADYAFCLIRLMKQDEALNLLQLASRDRAKNGFAIQIQLAHLHALRNEYTEALECQSSALRDYPAPKRIGALTPEQTAWSLKVEKEYVLPLYRSRRDDAKKQSTRVADTLDSLFPYRNLRDAKETRTPVEWHNSAGSYAAGTIDPAQKEKLPPDAVAILQQLLLWNPGDARLYWQLGEVYNSLGQVETAAKIFDECVDAPRNYTSPTLMEHRKVLREYLEEQAASVKAEEKKIEESAKTDMRYLLIGAGSIVAIFFVLQIRSFFRRMKLQ